MHQNYRKFTIRQYPFTITCSVKIFEIEDQILHHISSLRIDLSHFRSQFCSDIRGIVDTNYVSIFLFYLSYYFNLFNYIMCSFFLTLWLHFLLFELFVSTFFSSRIVSSYAQTYCPSSQYQICWVRKHFMFMDKNV